jgi:hypothetical protein
MGKEELFAVKTVELYLCTWRNVRHYVPSLQTYQRSFQELLVPVYSVFLRTSQSHANHIKTDIGTQ